jgi:hypothetical protein
VASAIISYHDRFRMPDVSTMTAQQKVEEAMRRSLPLLPAGARSMVEGLLSPQSIAIVAATLVVWAGSHLVGVGEIVDAILLAAGVLTLGFSVFTGARELYDFARISANARTDADLDLAAKHFANAITILGVSTVQALLLRRAGSPVLKRGRPQIRPLNDMGPPPPAGSQLRIARPSSLPGGSLGSTDAYGAIAIARNQSLTEQRLTLFHELVHRYFSPRTGPLRRLRANVAMSGYERSAFLRYLEEALAEGYGQLRVNGLARALAAYRFPIAYGYVAVSEITAEGIAVGTISLGGTILVVTIRMDAAAPRSIAR